MTDEAVTLIPEGKLRCVVTGNLRNDTPEEHVRQRIARSLMEDYGYEKRFIEVEFTGALASSKKRVDIALFPVEVEHKQENIKIIVECKREDVRPTWLHFTPDAYSEPTSPKQRRGIDKHRRHYWPNWDGYKSYCRMGRKQQHCADRLRYHR